MSLPERWGVLQFADHRVNETERVALPHWNARAVAMAVHNAQQAYSHPKSGGNLRQAFGSTTEEWGFTDSITELAKWAPPR